MMNLFKPPLTFLDLPLSQDFGNADAAILGIPFDCGRSVTRFGSRQGPNAIRNASILTAVLLKDAKPSPLDQLTIVDAGDIRLNLEDINEAFQTIELGMDQILTSNCIPVTVGGDGAVSLPQMRGLHRQHGQFAVLHIDAHTDAWPVSRPDDYTNANQFTHAATEALIDIDKAIHIGTRGPINANKIIDYTESLGYEVISFDHYRQWGEDKLLRHIKQRVGESKVYLCFDMDFFDPSVAPGVATPTPGGALPAEGLAILKGLSGLNIIAIDINTTTPIHDHTEATAILAASVLAESLNLIYPVA